MTKFNLFLALLISFFSTGCVKEIKNSDMNEKKVDFALVVHGGAGNIYEGRYSTEQERQYIEKLEEAINLGYDILNNNGSAVDAVETVIRVLEDSPLFNSGKGAVFTEDGNVELDASIMDGKNINCWRSSKFKTYKKPYYIG